MSLTEYKRKRYFKRTPEPTGEKNSTIKISSRKKSSTSKASANELSFVVQKHQASHLHYDFRLEIRGILKSWAVPKGPSMNPEDKRLAMLVEDHPFEYKNFEGIIPKGNYGAGTVMIWDEGSYHAVNDDQVISDKREADKILTKNFYSGKLQFELHGKKLKGKFTLAKAPQRGETSWLLMKQKDKYAKAIDITKKDRSVISDKNIDELSRSKDTKKWKSNRGEKQEKQNSHAPDSLNENGSFNKELDESTDYKQITAELLNELKGAKKSSMPKDISPMLASPSKNAFIHADWIYEVQWNGYRAIAYLNDGKAVLKSKAKNGIDKKFYPLHETLKQWPINAVVDGEIVVVNEEGLALPEQLEKWQRPEDGELLYYVFDLLWLDGYDLRHLSLHQRREMLQRLIPEESAVRFSEGFPAKGKEFFASAKKLGIEGIVAKKLDSTYKAGVRTKQWLQISIRDHRPQTTDHAS